MIALSRGREGRLPGHPEAVSGVGTHTLVPFRLILRIVTGSTLSQPGRHRTHLTVPAQKVLIFTGN